MTKNSLYPEHFVGIMSLFQVFVSLYLFFLMLFILTTIILHHLSSLERQVNKNVQLLSQLKASTTRVLPFFPLSLYWLQTLEFCL